MSRAIEYNIVIEQGAKFELSILYNDSDGNAVDLTGYTANMDIRNYLESSSAIDEFTESDGITLGGAIGTIDIEISAVVTKDYDFNNAVYDLELLPAGAEADTIRLMEGTVTLKKEVTR